MSNIILPNEAESGGSWELSDNQRKLRVTLPVAGGGVHQMILKADKVDVLLGGLGMARAGMEPPHDSFPDMVNAQILTLNHPQFQLAGVGEDRVLVVLDPRYGPLAFRFSPSSAKAIGEAFIAGRAVKET